MGASSLLVLILAGFAFAAGGIAIAKLLVKGVPNPQKGQAYECGVPTEGTPWNQFNVGYYLFALIFLVFDVELVFLYPWAVVYSTLGVSGLASVGVFLGIVIAGFFYAWDNGALNWK